MLGLITEATRRDHILGNVPLGVVHPVDPVVGDTLDLVAVGVRAAVAAGREKELRALSAGEKKAKAARFGATAIHTNQEG